VSNGTGCGAAVTSGGSNEHTGIRRIKERDLNGVKEVRGCPADRVVDHINAIGNGLINGSYEIGCKAAGCIASFC
jgi:hypothetical protein